MRLFVYGTLIGATQTPAARWLNARVRSVQPASVPGRLIAIPTPDGWFPALLPQSRSRVRGTCCTVALSRRDLARLDRYEGREYRRVTARALSEGALVTVMLYRWRGRVPRGARAIPGGDFLDWLGGRGLRAYGPRSRGW